VPRANPVRPLATSSAAVAAKARGRTSRGAGVAKAGRSPGPYRPPAATAMVEVLVGVCRALEAEAGRRLRRQGR
jgi:hypothetical protein